MLSFSIPSHTVSVLTFYIPPTLCVLDSPLPLRFPISSYTSQYVFFPYLTLSSFLLPFFSQKFFFPNSLLFFTVLFSNFLSLYYFPAFLIFSLSCQCTIPSPISIYESYLEPLDACSIYSSVYLSIYPSIVSLTVYIGITDYIYVSIYPYTLDK